MISGPEQSSEGASAQVGATDATELRQLALQTLLSLALLFALVLLAAYLFRSQLVGVSRAFVRDFGAFGVFLGFYIPDALTVPLPNDAFSTFGLLGGMTFGQVVAAGSLGSILGGCTGYALGKWAFGKSPRLRRMMEVRGLERIRRDGAWALALGAITPLPYSVFCWSSGAVGMPLRLFLGVSSLRIFRVAGYLWLIRLGVIQVTG